MEEIITEHLSKGYRNINLIFNIDPIFFKINNRIYFYNDIVFSKSGYEGVNWEGIIQNKVKEGFWISWSGRQKNEILTYRNGIKEGHWISWWSNGQKQEEGNYVNGKRKGLWSFWDQGGVRTGRRYR